MSTYCTCGHHRQLHTRAGGIIDPCTVDGCDCADLLFPEHSKRKQKVETRRITPPRDLADAQARLDATETALAGLVHENNELRAIIRRVREYAQHLHLMAEEPATGVYLANTYGGIATALERAIGDQP